MSRSLVISPVVETNDVYHVLGDVPILQSARSALLYWDNVEVPIIAQGAMPALDRFAQFARSEGVGDGYSILDRNSFNFDTEFCLRLIDAVVQRASEKNGADEISVTVPTNEFFDRTPTLPHTIEQ